MYRTSGDGEVGIFWIYRGELIQESLPHVEGEVYGEFINGKSGHYEFWKSVQKRVPALRNYEYDEVPRGRVIFSKRDGKFHIYGSEQFVKNEEERNMVLKAFNIPEAEAVFRFDEHYQICEADELEHFENDFGGRD